MVSVVQTSGGLSERSNYLLDSVDYRLIETPADREEIYRLRYRAYRGEGAVAPSPSQMVHDRYDDLPNSWIFGVYLDGVLMSSLRISVASPDMPTCPSLDVFPDLIKPELAAGKVLVDPTRFVTNPVMARRYPEIPYVTSRLGWVAFDPSNGISATDAHVRVAVGLDYLGAAPVRVTVRDGETTTIAVAAAADSEYPARPIRFVVAQPPGARLPDQLPLELAGGVEHRLRPQAGCLRQNAADVAYRPA